MAKSPNKVTRSWVPEKKAFEREVKNDSFYNSWPWRKLRKKQLSDYPLCKHCEDIDTVTPAKVADHIVPIRLGGDKLSQNNLQSLCERCHNKKSSAESRGMG